MPDHPGFISVTYGAGGYYPVRLVWDDSSKTYLKAEAHPYSSSDVDDARKVARKWADDTGLHYVHNSFGGD